MLIKPMLLQKANTPDEVPFNHYITELKLDGIRLLLSKWKGKITLYTRHGNDVTGLFPELCTPDIPNGTILDGELVVSNPNGKPDFEMVMERFQSKKCAYPVQFCVFDIPYWNEKKITHEPLLYRKKIVDNLLPSHDSVFPVKWVQQNADVFFQLVKEQSLEGIVAKRADSPYHINKRSNEWLKIINYQYETAVIIGYRKRKFGWLLGFKENFQHAGMMEFVPPQAKREFHEKIKNLVVKETAEFAYIQPQILCKIKYRNLTKAKKFRIPSFVNWE